MECFDPTESVAISELIPEIQIRLPDVSPVIIENELKRASVHFANRAKNLRCEMTIATEECISGYEIGLPKGFVPKVITNVKVFGKCYDQIGSCTDDSQNKKGFTLKNDMTWIEVNPAPTVADFRGIQLEALVVLDMNMCALPAKYYGAYGMDIINGTLSALYGMFGEPWYDLSASKYYTSQFYNGVAAGKEDRITEVYGDSGIPINARLII